MPDSVSRKLLAGFGVAGAFFGGVDGYLIGATTGALAGALVGSLVGVGLVVLSWAPRAQDAVAHPVHDKPMPNYMAIWGVLFALTVLEVFIAFMALPKGLIVAALVILAVWKALLVALYYMHLKFEPRRLWILAASPLPLALILVFAVLSERW